MPSRSIVVIIGLIGLLMVAGWLTFGTQPQAVPVEATVFFNKGGQAVNLEQQINSLLQSSTGFIDIAMYDFTLNTLADTLIAQQAAGRTVRVALSTEGGGGQAELEICGRLGAQGITVYRRSNMHDKYVILGDDTVITGSANWTTNSLVFEAQNVVVIKSAALVWAYKADFEDLIGHYQADCL